MDGDLLLIMKALSGARVRYLVVGGVAVVLHGHVRMTADLDLIVGLEESNARLAMQTFETLGFRARAPVAMSTFADRPTRESWIREKGLTVFSLWNPNMPLTEVDLFVDEPLDFDAAYSRALHLPVAGLSIPVASIDDLIALKKIAARDKDLLDIRVLEQIRNTRGGS